MRTPDKISEMIPADAVSLARRYSRAAIEVVNQIMEDGDSDAIRLRAAEVMLERGWGKASSNVDMKVDHKYSVAVSGLGREELVGMLRQRLGLVDGSEDIEFERFGVDEDVTE